jgi:hypothetical protein
VFRYKFAFASLLAVAIVSVLFIKLYSFKPQEKGVTTPQLRSGTQNPSFGIVAVKPELDISIRTSDDEALLAILEKYGTITGSSAEGKGNGSEFQPKENAFRKPCIIK